MRKYFLTCLLLVLLVLPCRGARAFTNSGVEIQPLNFGQIIVTNTSAAQTCTIIAGGTMSCSSGVQILQPGNYGIFRLSGYDPTVAIYANVTSITPMSSSGNTQTFSIGSFTFSPNINSIGAAQTPPGGTLTLDIGATLTTTANQAYPLSVYRGTYVLEINY